MWRGIAWYGGWVRSTRCVLAEIGTDGLEVRTDRSRHNEKSLWSSRTMTECNAMHALTWETLLPFLFLFPFFVFLLLFGLLSIESRQWNLLLSIVNYLFITTRKEPTSFTLYCIRLQFASCPTASWTYVLVFDITSVRDSTISFARCASTCILARLSTLFLHDVLVTIHTRSYFPKSKIGCNPTLALAQPRDDE